MSNNTWIYQVYDQNTESAQFGVFSPMVELWLSKFAGRKLPEWRDFELEEFSGWYGQLSLSQVASDFTELTHILWGTVITEWWGKDYTGKAMRHESREMQENWEEYEAPYLMNLIKNNGIGLCQGGLNISKRDFVHVTYIDLPLDYEGQVSRVLSIYSRGAQLECLQDRSPMYSIVEQH